MATIITATCSPPDGCRWTSGQYASEADARRALAEHVCSSPGGSRMNITEATAVDKVLTALNRLNAAPFGLDLADVEPNLLTDAEHQAVQLLRERAAKPLLVSPEAIGRVSA